MTRMTQTQTQTGRSVSAIFAQRAIAAVRDRPALLRVICAESGLSLDAFDAPAARIPLRAFGTIWGSVSRAIDDELLQLDTRPMKSGTFAFICRAVLHERTLGDALAQVMVALRLFLDDMGAELVVENGPVASIVFDSRIRNTKKRVFATELVVAMVYSIMCWLTERQFPLKVVELSYPRPVYAREYRSFLGGPLRFGAKRTRMVFEASHLALPLAVSEASLQAFLVAWPLGLVAQLRNPHGWTSRIRRLLRAAPCAEWPSEEVLAKRLKMALSTLKRRLAGEGTSYSLIKAELRQQIAVRLLGREHLPIREIATRTGFSDMSAFYKAFRSWTGKSPGDYRAAAR